MSSKVTDVFRASRSGAAAGRGGKAGKAAAEVPAAAPAAVQQPVAAAAQQQQAEADEVFLRQFDLDTRFGPCTGITRLQRWERAAKLGLDPPPEVPAIVRRHGEDTSFNRDLFYQPY
ncbi:DNA polymerase delta subunit 4 [Chlorella sorokiniana]|jgi:DNA polymerase delta subunit 4|uniref:DNA polymerase delta subunit 4 n=1 Tax=Chlorella sorokiniana TaxID=3076 RepID=A0A2P6U1F6_CHLSO|nr:DNA polymerase delta subunit 4 [Chlorella sorokiniana]|eukprot:PRW60138.1 DNA polymerase delta subunit 4 [Chlorella sorokiniana]